MDACGKSDSVSGDGYGSDNARLLAQVHNVMEQCQGVAVEAYCILKFLAETIDMYKKKVHEFETKMPSKYSEMEELTAWVEAPDCM
jgi:hypothetical protein